MKNEHLEESDWKHLREITPECRERYLARVNSRFTALLSDESAGTATERFWQMGEELEKESFALRDCLDDHRRSTAVRKAAGMFSYGLLEESDLEGFTDEFAERIRNLAEILG